MTEEILNSVKTLALRHHLVEKSLRDSNCAEAVREPRVHRTGVDEMSRPELANTPKPLTRRTVDDRHLDPVEVDVAVHRVGDDLARAKDLGR